MTDIDTQKTDETQIGMLNTLVKMKIAPSTIGGVGVFAITDIPEGTKLFADNMPEIFNLSYKQFDKLYPHVRDLLLSRWPLIVSGSAFVYPDARMLAYMNHSDEPNYDAKTDRTLRDIKQGEEITENYRLIDGWERVYPWLTANSSNL